MDLRQIEYFVRVAELGSFTRASIALSIAQPALSRQIRLLEMELEQSLLIRTGRGVRMTEAGKAMLEQGRGVLHQVSRLRDELGRIRGGVAGGVSLGLPPSFSRLLSVPLVRAATRELPGVRLSISEGLTTSLQDMLVSGQIDLALLYHLNLAAKADIAAEYLREEPLYLFSRYRVHQRTCPIPLSAIGEQPLVIPRRPNAFRVLIEDALAALGQPLQIAMEADGLDVMLGLVADGVGSAVLGASAVATAARSGRYRVQPIHGVSASIYLSTSSQRPTTQAQREMMRLIRQALSDGLDPSRHYGAPREPESWP